MTQPSIACPRCGKTSYHLADVAVGYCGRCHWWTSDPAGVLNQAWVIAQVEQQGAIAPLEHGPVPQPGRPVLDLLDHGDPPAGGVLFWFVAVLLIVTVIVAAVR